MKVKVIVSDKHKRRLALACLEKFFGVCAEDFLHFRTASLWEWAQRLGPKYQLSNREHQWLIGRGGEW